MSTSSSSAESSPSGAALWRLPLLLALVLLCLIAAATYRVRNGGTTVVDATTVALEGRPADGASNASIRLAIKFGDGRVREFDSLPWYAEMNVAEAMAAAARAADGPVFVYQGAGAGAYLAEIDGVANEGTDGRNWTYSVNGHPADRSFAVYLLKPGDRILWAFTSQQ